jgi:hypothetical protein
MNATGDTSTIHFSSKRFDPVSNIGLGLRSTKGTFDGRVLNLGYEQIPVTAIKKVAGGFGRLIIEKKIGKPTFAEIKNKHVLQYLVRMVNATASEV